MISFLDSERILVVAPHPDDESLGTGGLLHRAFSSGIPVKILFATNGDNNPWAQRYWERRWTIGAADQQRWGKRRQQEALDAITVLGGDPDCASFLDCPDQGITDFLMSGDPTLRNRLTEEIRAWQPTLLLIPTIIDSHPDHSALCVLLSQIANSLEIPRILEYLIHRPSVEIVREPITLRLTAAEIENKRRAILCHQTQLALGGGRFTRFAAPEEAYYLHNGIGVPSGDRPFQSAIWRDGILDLRMATFRRDRVNAALLMAFRSGNGREQRWRLPLPLFSGTVNIVDAISHRTIQEARLRRRPGLLQVEIPFPDVAEFELMFAKLSGSTLFFDRSGWFQVALPKSLRLEPGFVKSAVEQRK
jgi:LmbE family N-acetylglucosaminyl deacetylase